MEVHDIPRIKGVWSIRLELAEEWTKWYKAHRRLDITIYPATNTDESLDSTFLSEGVGLPHPETGWGPTAKVGIMPHFMAPGSGLLTTVPRNLMEQDWGFSTGAATYLAAAYAAAVFGLIKQIQVSLSKEKIANVLSASSSPMHFFDGEKKGKSLAPVTQQGPGLINAYEAAIATVVPNVQSIYIGEMHEITAKVPDPVWSLKIENRGSEAITLKQVYKGTTVYYALNDERRTAFPPEIRSESGGAQFREPRITIKEGTSETITFGLTGLFNDRERDRIPIQSGFVTLVDTKRKMKPLIIPYWGFM